MTIVGFADKVLTGGGKRPSLLVWWFLGAWFVNSIVFCFAAERMAPNSVPLLLNTDLRNNCAAKPNVGWVRCELGAMKEFPKFYPLLYAADVLVPIMDLQQFGIGNPFLVNGIAALSRFSTVASQARSDGSWALPSSR